MGSLRKQIQEQVIGAVWPRQMGMGEHNKERGVKCNKKCVKYDYTEPFRTSPLRLCVPFINFPSTPNTFATAQFHIGTSASSRLQKELRERLLLRGCSCLIVDAQQLLEVKGAKWEAQRLELKTAHVTCQPAIVHGNTSYHYFICTIISICDCFQLRTRISNLRNLLVPLMITTLSC